MRPSTTILSAAILLLIGSPAVAGSLTPPGPPAPTFKTLSDIEPRTLISPDQNSLEPVVIDQPGSYYLGRDIQALPGQDAITINANNVSLDLNGFTVRGNLEVMDGNGIVVNGENATIRNGQIRYLDGDGVNCSSGSVTLINVDSTHNGGSGATCAHMRVDGGDFSHNTVNGLGGLYIAVDRVTANENGANGVGMGADSRVAQSSFIGNTGFGIACPQGNALVTETISKHNDAGNRLGCSVFSSEMP